MLRFTKLFSAIVVTVAIVVAALFSLASVADATVIKSKKMSSAGASLKDKNGNNKVDTIVHLMMENRAFDHILGWSSSLLGVDGLTGNEYNRLSTLDPNSPKVYVDDKAPFIASMDPDHATYATTSKLYGMKNLLDANYVESNSGFVEWEYMKHRKEPNTTAFSVMGGFAPERLPTFVNFAQEFATFDRFFASVPGSTWPNRAYALMGGSYQNTETYFFYKGTNGQLYPQKTIFDQLEEEGLDWLIVTQDVLWENFIAKIALNPDKVVDYDTFKFMSSKGTLPPYVFINPQAGVNLTSREGAKDCHPSHDVRICSNAIADVYDTLRASPKWNSTMFVLSFDEHGGFYDHVKPPTQGVPPPTPGETGIPDSYFKFDRLGLRVPFLVASPWIPKGTVVTNATGDDKPFANSEYDLTSIIATVRKVLGMKSTNLTARDGWASTFAGVLSLDEPRADCPATLARTPVTASDSTWSVDREAAQSITDLQQGIALGLHQLTDGVPHRKTGHPRHLKTEGDYALWAHETWHSHKRHHALHKKGLLHAAEAYETIVAAVLDVEAVVLGEKSYTIVNASHCGFPTRWTISSRTVKDPHTSSPYCLTWNITSQAVAFTPCLPSADPCKNQNANQFWTVDSRDSSYRPVLDTSYCLTTVPYPTGTAPTVQKCTGNNVLQRWAFNGDDKAEYRVQGESGGGELMFGDGVFLLFMKPRHLSFEDIQVMSANAKKSNNRSE